MNQDANQQDKANELLERARKGVLKHMLEQGGTVSLEELHDFSLKSYFIQHQRFSKMMEDHVDEGLAEYDPEAQTFSITDAGKEFVAS